MPLSSGYCCGCCCDASLACFAAAAGSGSCCLCDEHSTTTLYFRIVFLTLSHLNLKLLNKILENEIISIISFGSLS